MRTGCRGHDYDEEGSSEHDHQQRPTSGFTVVELKAARFADAKLKQRVFDLFCHACGISQENKQEWDLTINCGFSGSFRYSVTCEGTTIQELAEQAGRFMKVKSHNLNIVWHGLGVMNGRCLNEDLPLELYGIMAETGFVSVEQVRSDTSSSEHPDDGNDDEDHQ